MWGDIVFEAPTKGVYSIYWLPYTPWENWTDPDGDYYKADYAKAEKWFKSLNIKTLPEAHVERIEARSEFNSFWPMEIPAMPDELDKLKAAINPLKGYAVFTEPRSIPVKMLDAIPVRWLINGPSTGFKGKVQPGEFYPFQIVVWSFGKALKADLSYENLTSADGNVIPASAFQCINIDITDFSGKKRHTPTKVAANGVQPLWVIASIPADTKAGLYKGKCIVKVAGMEETAIPLELEVGGEILADGGVGDTYRLARLVWLNSTIGNDDTVPAPFTPIVFKDSKIKVAQAKIKLAASGMPEKISVKKHNIFAYAPYLRAVINDAPVKFKDNGIKTGKTGKDRVEWQGSGNSAQLKYSLNGSIESDGMFEYAVTLTPKRNLTLQDFSVILPILPNSAKYIIGLGIRGGKRSGNASWKWNPKNATNYVWLGNYNRGIQLHLMPGNDEWEAMSVTPSPEWNNHGRGGITVKENPRAVVIRAYSGKRRLHKNKPITFRFRMSVTPCREQTPERWSWRFKGWGTPGNIGNVFHSAWGNPNINYPFTELDKLGEEIEKIKNEVIGGVLAYNSDGIVTREHGYVEAELRINFDPETQIDPIALPFINFKDHSAFGVAWLPQAKGVRLIAIKYTPSVTTFPFELYARNLNWEKGEKHRIGFSWHNDSSSIWVDGKKVAKGKFKLSDYFSRDQFKTGEIAFTGAVHVGKVRAGKGAFNPGPAGPDIVNSASDTLSDSLGSKASQLEGGFRIEDGFVCLDGGKERTKRKATFYYTVREMSVLAPEIWAFRSLPDQIFTPFSFVYTPEGARITAEGTGYAWLREHLIKGYSPAWKTKTYSGERDFAIGLKAPTRWHNWYLAGVNYLSKRFDVNGIYLDAFGAGRTVAKRLRKVLLANNPHEGHLWWHAGNNFDFMNNGSSIYSTNMEAMPFYSQAWNGEAVDFNHGPNYYLIELSGIPFGLPAEMLEHNTGGNAYRGMVYGMSGRIHPSAKYMHKLWDDFDIATAKMIGYWSEKPVVRLSNSCMRSTAYVHKGERTLIAIADWAGDSASAPRTGTAGLLRGTLRLDGRVNETAWQDALVLKDFSILHSGAASEKATEARILWDKNNLYFAFICRGQQTSKLIANKRGIDQKLWEDDSVEIYIRPDYSTKDWVQFIGNSTGAVFDSKNRNVKWNGNWRYATYKGDNFWSGEGSIPWRSLGLNGREIVKNGASIGFNFCRTIHLPAFEFSMWAQNKGSSPADIKGYGKISFADKSVPVTESKQKFSSTMVKINYKALGLDPEHIHIFRPEIRNFQTGKELIDLSKPLEVEKNKGNIIILEKAK